MSRLFLPVFVLLAALLMATTATPTYAQTATPPPATATPAPTGCVDGADAVTGDPCLEIQTTSLMTQIFKWANSIILILIPLIAIAIGIAFGGNILAGIKNIFGNIKIG